MEGAEKRPPDDLLSRVRDVCKLHWRFSHVPDAQIVPLESRGLGYVKVSYTRGPWAEHSVVGVHDGQITGPVVAEFHALATAVGTRSPLEIVYTGEPPVDSVAETAKRFRVWLRPFDEYVGALWDHSSYYVSKQAEGLAADIEYPLNLHVDKRWAPLGVGTPAESTVVPHLLETLAAGGPRFVLVLGDFGTGKTFLLHKVAYELAVGDGLVPVLVTMRDLEKGRTLDELLAQHMARAGVDPFHSTAFRYLLREGRIALLFDGFDELALRTSYERVPQHFETLREAAAGAAKVVVTSRHQYFATDRAVRNALGEDVNRLPGSQIIRLFPLEKDQRRTLVVKAFEDNETAADEFLTTLDRVPNLLDLAANPRMLTFMIRWYREGILTAATLAKSAENRDMTAGALYELLLVTWLKHEVARQTASGGLTPLSVVQRMDALRETATRMWRTGQRSIALEDLGEVADRITDLARLEMRPREAVQAVGSSTVLVRRGEDEFAFIHQSVMEWFVADTARRAFDREGTPGVDKVLADHELTTPMVDFLCDLAGANRVVAWARDVVARSATPGPAAKANAALVLQRRQVQAGQVNYAGQDLRGRDLSGQSLNQANLENADLSGAVLPTEMREANLRHAKLVGAKLSGANLTGADLTNADLQRAQLVGAVLTGAKLDKATLERAVLIGARVDADALRTADVAGAALPGAEVVPQVAGESAVCCAASLARGMVVTGHEDGSIRVHDVNDFRTMRTDFAHDTPVKSLAASWRGELLLSVGADNSVLLWDMTTWTSTPMLSELGAAVRLVAVGGRRIAAATGDGVYVHSVSGSQPILLTSEKSVSSIAMDVTGRWLAIAADGVVKVWNLRAHKEQPSLTGYKGVITGLRINRVGEVVVAVGTGGVRGWGISIPDGARAGKSTDIAFSRSWFAYTDKTQIVVQSDVQRVLEGPMGRCRTLLAERTGRWLLSGHHNGTIALWNPQTGKVIGQIAPTRGTIEAIGVDPLDEWLVVAGVRQDTQVWRLTTGGQPDKLKAGVFAIAVDPVTRGVITDSAPGMVRVSRVRGVGTAGPLLERELPPLEDVSGIPTVAVSADGKWVAHGSAGVTKVILADRSSGEVVRHFEATSPGVNAFAFDPQGQWLAAGGFDGKVQLFALTDPGWFRFWRRRTSLRGLTAVGALAFHPDGRWLAAAGVGGRVMIWSRRRKSVLKSLEPGGRWINALAVDPGGRWLASAGEDGRIRLWDTESWQLLRSMQADSKAVNALAVSPTGRWLASGGNDGLLRLWNPTTGDLMATFTKSDNGWAILLADGRYLVGGKPENVWWSAGLCRFDAADLDELAPYLPNVRRMSKEEPLGLGE
ncbi:hypothetical protein Lesp02_57630 [Lentzea sp. NBRC 105346]|uniref:NACHT and WD40 repeat domain-containing protein n=1 Tax=Lentzea sp. NBRC 105346 TaxID=3032205 RepID=UPI0024A4D98A|nr:pentapeptide repeat-containing protein [Lentzea sp. NBRC 105346]GLZ33575.1 hypothetical protein Lesp02_57630 [Lentzea sp. NBRC 105346]